MQLAASMSYQKDVVYATATVLIRLADIDVKNVVGSTCGSPSNFIPILNYKAIGKPQMMNKATIAGMTHYVGGHKFLQKSSLNLC